MWGNNMKLDGAQKYYAHKFHEHEYRESIVTLMVKLEAHSEEFKTPEQIIALVHEYTELMATLRHLDQMEEINSFMYDEYDDDDDEEDIDEDGEEDDE